MSATILIHSPTKYCGNFYVSIILSVLWLPINQNNTVNFKRKETLQHQGIKDICFCKRHKKGNGYLGCEDYRGLLRAKVLAEMHSESNPEVEV